MQFEIIFFFFFFYVILSRLTNLLSQGVKSKYIRHQIAPHAWSVFTQHALIPAGILQVEQR